MLGAPLRCPLPHRTISGGQPAVRRKHRTPRCDGLPALNIFDALVQTTPPMMDALEVAKSKALAHSTNPYYLLQWSMGMLCVPCLSGLFYHLGLPAVQQYLETQRSKKDQVRQCCLHGIDISGSEFLVRPKVKAALEFAERAHHGQKRKTGDPYITHCLHTALILEDLLASVTSVFPDAKCEQAIICAILHDVLDDTSITYDDLQTEFEPAVADVVKQISDMSSLVQLIRSRRRQAHEGHLVDDADKSVQDDRLRRLILKKLDDPMVLIVKLADRLHNLRTIYALKPEKQRAVALETEKILCTLAERLGLFSLKAELEDLCFCVLQPEKFWDVYQRLQLLWKSEKMHHHAPHKPRPFITDSEIPHESDLHAQKHIKELLQMVTPFTAVRTSNGRNFSFGLHFLHKCADQLLIEIGMLSFNPGLEINVVGRLKSLRSTYRKMQKKGIPIEKVYDVLGLRVIVTEDGDAEMAQEVCYKILQVVRCLWNPIPQELDDYIVAPKESGYQSLHVAVLGPGGIPFEVQIRTASMDDRAEYGQAAHWRYKESVDVDASESNALTVRDAIWGKQNEILGHPVVRIRDGRWRDGIVIRTEKEGLVIVVAVNIAQRMSHSWGSYTFAVRDSYTRLTQYVEEKRWTAPGSGDLTAVIERYVLCADKAYHRIDAYGHKHATIVRPVRVFDTHRSLESHLETLDSGVVSNSVPHSEETNTEDGGTHLGSILEAQAAPEASTVDIILWPECRIHSVPPGTTAGEVLASRGRLRERERESNVAPLVNVNDRIVRSDTPLKDGDRVVIEGQ